MYVSGVVGLLPAIMIAVSIVHCRFDAVHVLLSEVSREHWVKGLPSEVISRSTRKYLAVKVIFNVFLTID